MEDFEISLTEHSLVDPYTMNAKKDSADRGTSIPRGRSARHEAVNLPLNLSLSVMWCTIQESTSFSNTLCRMCGKLQLLTRNVTNTITALMGRKQLAAITGHSFSWPDKPCEQLVVSTKTGFEVFLYLLWFEPQHFNSGGGITLKLSGGHQTWSYDERAPIHVEVIWNLY